MRTVPLILALLATPAAAHFGMVIPSDTMVAPDEPREIGVEISFGHPFERIGLGLDTRPTFRVHLNGETTDLTGDLTPVQVWDKPAYTLTYPLRRPGVHIFEMTPEPFWEPAEDAFILHLTKTYIAAFDDAEGWDAELGLDAEIVPLTPPFGLWSGNLFQGIVKRGGQPEPFAEVEVEYLNTTGATAPSELMITQTVKADANGIFSYAPPGPGWWGFAALGEADYTIDHEGTPKPVELGAVLWVHFEEWK